MNATKIIEHAVNRFLGWKFPKSFSPDGGISFKEITHPLWTYDTMPTGTNLLNAQEAKEMFEYCLAPTDLEEDDKYITDVGSECYDFYKDGAQFSVLIQADNKIALVANVNGTPYRFSTGRVVDAERCPTNFYNCKLEPLPELYTAPVMWQYRYMESEYVYSLDGSRWSKWMTVEARPGSTVQARVEEIQFCNYNDMGQYEIRALYARQEDK